MPTRQYKVVQPTHIDNPFDTIPPSANQLKETHIELRAQKHLDDYSLSTDNKEQISKDSPIKQSSKTNTHRNLNHPHHTAQPRTNYPIIVQPSPSKKEKKRRRSYDCCDTDEDSCCWCCSGCCLRSLNHDSNSSCHKYSSSSTTSSHYFGCAYCCDDQSTSCGDNGGSYFSLGCGCCDCGDCDCGDCDCDGCDCDGCD